MSCDGMIEFTFRVLTLNISSQSVVYSPINKKPILTLGYAGQGNPSLTYDKMFELL